MTAPHHDELTKLIARAESHLRASRHGEAAALIEQADPTTLPVSLLDRALPTLLMAVTVHAGEFEALGQLESIVAARDDEAARGILKAYRAEASEDDPERRARLATEALHYLEETAPISRHRALAALLMARLDMGGGLDGELLDLMEQQEATMQLVAPVDSALAQRGFLAYQVGDLDGSYTALRALTRQAHRADEPLMERIFRAHLATVNMYAGRLRAARADLSEASTLAGSARMLPVEARAGGLLAIRTADADALQAVLLEPPLYGSEAYSLFARAALIGLDAAMREDWREAHVQLTQASRRATRLGLKEPGRKLWLDFDLARAALGVGRTDEALSIADRLDAVSNGTRPLLTGVAERIRGIAEGSRERLEASAALLTGAGYPDQHALTLLELGRSSTADGDPLRARRSLERAQVIVRRTGDVAIGHLVETALFSASVDGRLALLTTRERQVAMAAANGATNRQIAAAHFTSVRTVESQLASVYRKLGIRSRAQLLALLAGASAVSSDPRGA